NRYDKRKGRPVIRAPLGMDLEPDGHPRSTRITRAFDAIEERADRNTNHPGRRASHTLPHRSDSRPSRLYPLRGGPLRTLRPSHGGQPSEGKTGTTAAFVTHRGAIAADAAGHPGQWASRKRGSS